MGKVKALDYFSTNYNLFFNGKESFKTRIGGVITIISIILFCLYIIFLSKDIVFKQNPITSYFTQSSAYSYPVVLNLPLSIQIQELDLDLNFFSFEAFYYQIEKVGNQSIHSYPPIQLTLTKCRYNVDFNYSEDIFILNNIKDSLCFQDKNLILSGNPSSQYFNYVRFNIVRCNYSLKNCSELMKKNYTLSLFREGFSYDPTNFDNPTKAIILQDKYKFDTESTRSLTYNFQNYVIKTDNGVLLSDYKNQSFSTLDYIEKEISIPSQNLVSIIFQSSINTSIQKREYIGISDIISKIGGAMNSYLMLISAILKSVYLRKMNEKLLRRLFDDNPAIFSPKKSKNLQENFIEIINLNHLSRRSQNFSKFNLEKDSQEKNNLNLEIVRNMNRNVSSPLRKSQANPKQIMENLEIHENQINLESNNSIIQNPQKHLRRGSRVDYPLLFDEKSIKNMKFTFFQHFRMYFLKCCAMGRMKNLYNNFNELLKFSLNYFDIVHIVKKLHEFEKMKYIIFDNKQLSIFNKIAKPSNPLVRDKSKRNAITERLRFDYDLDNQNKLIEEVMANQADFAQEKLNERLIKYYLNIVD